MKKSFISMPLSKFPREQWIEIILPHPEECRFANIPNSGLFVIYKAYFPTTGPDKIFDLTLPYQAFKDSLKSIHPSEKINLCQPISFELMKCAEGRIQLRNWRVI
jgi:hypothetical protein